ncbi:MAG: PilW family protein [Pseudomonadota bacterium]
MTKVMCSKIFYSRGKREVGLSLVELLVAIALGLVLLAGIGTIYVGSQQTYRMQEANARLQENGRYAIEIIGRSLRQAGADASITPNVTAVTEECIAVLPCALSSGACTATGNAPTGTTCAMVPASSNVCVATNHQCFALQGANGASGAADGMAAQYFAEVGGGTDCTGANSQENDVVTNSFTLSGTDLRCTGRIDRDTGGVISNVSLQTQPILSNVEDFQVIYGIDAAGNDQSADIYTASPSAAQWPNVVTAKVCVMIRSDEQGLASSTQRPLDCPRALGMATGQSNQTNDTRLHRTFVATFNLRNRVTNLP